MSHYDVDIHVHAGLVRPVYPHAAGLWNTVDSNSVGMMSLRCRQQIELLLCRYSMGNGWSYPSHLPQLPDGSVDWGVVNVVSSLPNRFIEQPRLPGLGLTPWYLHARRMLPSGSLRAHASYHSRNHTGNYTAYQNAMAPAEHRPHHYVNSSAYVPINVTAHYANHTVPRQNAMRLHNAFPANASAPHSRNSSLLG